uniref:Uncharacterized protein n=1 Tax=uncultured marine virus TaxID=186617 RepID=A0A0F7L6F7_9VIRU|nr:hypothetical protein [uncultured marine virus]
MAPSSENWNRSWPSTRRNSNASSFAFWLHEESGPCSMAAMHFCCARTSIQSKAPGISRMSHGERPSASSLRRSS